MSISHLLESFEGAARGAGGALGMSEMALEEEKLEAFERGYQAGWDDSAKAQSDETARVTSDFANNLKELSFTYHEAHNHALKSLKPLIEHIVHAVLPQIAGRSLAAQIAEQVGEIAANGKGEAVIAVSPANAAAVRALLPENPGFPLVVRADADVGEGQAFLSFAAEERQIDLEEVLAGVNNAVEAFFIELERTTDKEARDAG